MPQISFLCLKNTECEGKKFTAELFIVLVANLEYASPFLSSQATKIVGRASLKSILKAKLNTKTKQANIWKMEKEEASKNSDLRPSVLQQQGSMNSN